MANHLSWLKAAGLALALCGLTASAARNARSTGYLTAVGPADLRFQLITLPRAPLPLPPLNQVTNPSPEPKIDNTPATTPSVPAGGYAPLLPEPTPAPEPAAQPESMRPNLPPTTGQSDAAAAAAISPQSVLRYLTPMPTNAPAGQFLAPVFVPPMAPPPPSSTATYESH